MTDPTDMPAGDDVRQTWDALAGYWDERMTAGETWQRTLIAPSVERLLHVRPGERILELSCGNGEFARRMAELGATVLATDFSSAMLERARSYGGDVEYRQVDATDEAALLTTGGEESFDAAVSNMAVMDMITIEPMARALARLVAPGGRLVVSTTHPAFNSGDGIRITEETDDERGVVRTYSIKRSDYITPSVGKGVAVEGQPVAQWYFHRPLRMILEPFFDAGWVVDGLDEPVLPQPTPLFSEIPGVLVLRFRRPG